MILDEKERTQEIKLWENRLVKNCSICQGTGSVPSESGLAKKCSCREKADLNAYLVCC